MFLKCFLINQVQITIPMIPMFLCSCAKKETSRFNSYRRCRWSHLHIKKKDRVSSLKSNALKILSFKDCFVYQNSFLQILKSQPGYDSYMCPNFVILSLMLVKSMFLYIKKMFSMILGSFKLRW